MPPYVPQLIYMYTGSLLHLARRNTWHLSLVPKTFGDTKIHYFQFRILHRIIGVNTLLYKMKIISSPMCTFCKSHDETIEHLFWHCPFVKSFWNNSSRLILKEPFDFDEGSILFGYTPNVAHPINFFILHGKYYVYSCKLNNCLPKANAFYFNFSFAIRVELYILKNRGTERSEALKNFFHFSD